MPRRNTPKSNRRPKDDFKSHRILPPVDSDVEELYNKEKNPSKRQFLGEKTKGKITDIVKNIDINRGVFLSSGNRDIAHHGRNEYERRVFMIINNALLCNHKNKINNPPDLHLILLAIIFQKNIQNTVQNNAQTKNITDTLLLQNIEKSLITYIEESGEPTKLKYQTIEQKLLELINVYSLKGGETKNSTNTTMATLLSCQKCVAYNFFENIMFANLMMDIFGTKGTKNKIVIKDKTYTISLPTIWEDRSAHVDMILTDDMHNKYAIDFTFLPLLLAQKKQQIADDNTKGHYTKKGVVILDNLDKILAIYRNDRIRYIIGDITTRPTIPDQQSPRGKVQEKLIGQLDTILKRG